MINNSLKLTIAYTIGHVCIAMVIVKVMTGASLWEAGSVALLEPFLNGLWLYVLHSTWSRFQNKKSSIK